MRWNWSLENRPGLAPLRPADLMSRHAAGYLEGHHDREPDWFVIGREVDTGGSGRIGHTGNRFIGNLIVIELKRDQTPRDVVAKVLSMEMGLFIKAMISRESIAPISLATIQLDQRAFVRRSEADSRQRRPEDLNQEHELVVVASEFDLRSERIVTYVASA